MIFLHFCFCVSLNYFFLSLSIYSIFFFVPVFVFKQNLNFLNKIAKGQTNLMKSPKSRLWFTVSACTAAVHEIWKT